MATGAYARKSGTSAPAGASGSGAGVDETGTPDYAVNRSLAATAATMSVHHSPGSPVTFSD